MSAGWTPASFHVATGETGKAYGDEEGATRLLQRPEDFMDEEDLAVRWGAFEGGKEVDGTC